MKEYTGQGVCGGVCVGEAFVFRAQTYEIEEEDRTVDPKESWQAFLRARDATRQELEQLYRESALTLGEEQAEIFSVQAMMAQDEELSASVQAGMLELGLTAMAAVRRAIGQREAMFLNMEDAYLRERAADVRDVGERLCSWLAGRNQRDECPLPQRPCILCATELSPAQTAGLDRHMVLGFVTAHGSPTSHTAILARSMNIPALVGVGEAAIAAIRDGELLAMDALNGTLILSPDESTLRTMEQRADQMRQQQAQSERYRGKKTRSAAGREIHLYANAALPEDVDGVLAADAEGIGLFRSEFLYLGRQSAPDEEEQFEIYRSILERMGDRRVIVRTLDIGADKQAGCLPSLGREENPALGCRAIRHSLRYPALFLTQAKALLRASLYGRLSVMFPLISSEEELRGILSLWDRAREEVGACADVELGVMIETPAAALISDRLARMVAFFSIGTNDLTQYTLAMDRQNEALQPFYRPHHPAVLSLIRMTVENAKAAGIWVGICGELGADLSLTETLVGMGIDEFSVAPSRILALREKIASVP